MRDESIETLTSGQQRQPGIPRSEDAHVSAVQAAGSSASGVRSDAPFAEQALAALSRGATLLTAGGNPAIPPPNFRVAQWIMRLLDWALKKSQPNPPPTPPDPPPEDRPAIMAYIEALAAAGVTPA